MLRSSLVLLALPLSACGVDFKTQRRTELVQQLRLDDAFAESYFVDDLDCQMQEEGVASIGATSVHQWQGDATRSVEVPFAGTSAKRSLVSGAVDATYFNFHQQKECRDGESVATCSGKTKIVADRRLLKICRTDGSYPRASVEGVALASLASINAAAAYYDQIPGSAVLLRSSLLVLPTVEHVVNDANGEPIKRAVTTDNLAYAADFGGAPAFAVYPKGRKAKQAGLWKDLNLWEVPWGLAHEFGHHVFRTHTAVVHFDKDVPLHSIPDRDARREGLSLDGRTVTGEDVLDAINEGYADLFAFYSLGGAAGQIRNVDCFDTNRDVASPEFVGGRAKILDKDILAQWNATTVIDSDGCDAPRFQDVHDTGAVIAHGIDQLFSAGGATTLEKASLLLKWGTRLGDRARELGRKSLTFDRLLDTALLTVAPGKKLKIAQCDAVKTSFPEYAAAWLAKGYTCE